jgi:hypothetical protein
MMYSFSIAKLVTVFVFALIHVVQVRGDKCGDYAAGPCANLYPLMNVNGIYRVGSQTPNITTANTKEWSARTDNGRSWTGHVAKDGSIHMANKNGLMGENYALLEIGRGNCVIKSNKRNAVCDSPPGSTFYETFTKVSVYQQDL